jgi:hypothetical protein
MAINNNNREHLLLVVYSACEIAIILFIREGARRAQSSSSTALGTICSRLTSKLLSIVANVLH